MALCRSRSTRLAGAFVAAAALLAPGPLYAQPKPKKPPSEKKTDMEVDPDAKPKEEKPLPPPEPGAWGVGGKDEEGKFAPGGEKDDKDKDKDKPRDKDKPKEDEPKTDLGPARSVYLDWVSGFGSIQNVTDPGKTTVTSMSFVFHFSWRFADIWTVGARFPFSQANLAGPLGNTDVAKTVAPGNLEVYVRPSFQLTRRLRLPAQVALTFPSAQGDLFGDTTMDHVAPAQALVNQAASAARGWEEMPLFAPHRFGIRAGAGITYDADSIHFAAGTNFDIMPRVGGNDAATGNGGGTTGQIHSVSYAWVTRASFFYGFAVGPGFIEPGLRAWLVVDSLPWYTAAIDDSGAQFVLEPAVNARFGLGEEKATWINAGIGFIAPVKGPLGGSNSAASNVDGFRVHAECQF